MKIPNYFCSHLEIISSTNNGILDITTNSISNKVCCDSIIITKLIEFPR